jgi:proton-translocating NADH-quinone oxidoreductase chain L
MGSLGPEELAKWLPCLLGCATILPLIGFLVELFCGAYLWDRLGKRAALCSIACIGLGFVLSFSAFLCWASATDDAYYHAVQGEHGEHAEGEHSEPEGEGAAEGLQGHPYVSDVPGESAAEDSDTAAKAVPGHFSGTFYTLAEFGSLRLSVDYYIDSLTILMFCMVTFIATCIHIFAVGYMADELTEDYVDHFAHTADGKHVHRRGRYYQFFAYMSLFCFSMLGLVLAGNIFQVFIFWELVGICSYLLIGFYVERKSANVAANKAFIVNRVGDFGFIIGLMILWTWCGTFQFGDYEKSVLSAEIVAGEETAELGNIEDEVLVLDGHDRGLATTDFGTDGRIKLRFRGTAGTTIHIAARDRKGHGAAIEIDKEGEVDLTLDSSKESPTTAGSLVEFLADYGVANPGLFSMIRDHHGELTAAGEDVALLTEQNGDRWEVSHDESKQRKMPYMLLVVAGLGVFAGCIGKSAQFPLQTWLPDAMEGPTPVSALVHSATMVAAGVYLAARFYPVFTAEVLLTIAYVGCITLFVAATIAVVATDIKRVLAYSTISQLGYMMLAIGLGGWAAGLFHLITHAFFKSLMFLCSGSVIHGCHHEQEMTKMGGLRKKMPITAFTMLVGVIAIAGLAIPGVVAFSGYHSKDAILATALAYTSKNSLHFLLFLVPLVTAGITAFYMFRLWFYTFTGKPRDEHVYEHCHESPGVMCAPLLVLAVLAAGCAIGGEHGHLFGMIKGSIPAGVDHGTVAFENSVTNITLPSHGDIHKVHSTAGKAALLSAVLGMVVAFLLYCRPVVDPARIRDQMPGVHNFLVEKWQFDNLYEAMFVKPALCVGRWCATFDRVVLDGILHASAKVVVSVSQWDRKFDEGIIDGFVNLLGTGTRRFGLSLRVFQTGRMRQYVMFIAVSVLVLFALLFLFVPKA